MVHQLSSGPCARQIAGFDGTRVADGSDSQRMEWLCSGVSTPAEAEDFMISEGLPPSFLEFRRPGEATRRIKLQRYNWREAIDGNERAYHFKADYSFEKLERDEWTLAVSTTGGSLRMTTSLATTRYGNDVPDFKNAIDVRDGKPQGVDRVIPTVRYTVTYRLERPTNPFGFSNLCTLLTGTTNTNVMLDSQPGELLFLGFDGNFGNQIDPELQFHWAKSLNANLSIGNIAGIAKKGHEYLWIQYEDTENGTGASKIITHEPRGIFVEKIYGEADHSQLGLLLP